MSSEDVLKVYLNAVVMLRIKFGGLWRLVMVGKLLIIFKMIRLACVTYPDNFNVKAIGNKTFYI